MKIKKSKINRLSKMEIKVIIFYNIQDKTIKIKQISKKIQIKLFNSHRKVIKMITKKNKSHKLQKLESENLFSINYGKILKYGVTKDFQNI